MNSIKGESHDLYREHDGKKTLLFGIALLIIGLMMQNRFSIPDVLVVVGAILVLKSILMMVLKKA